MLYRVTIAAKNYELCIMNYALSWIRILQESGLL